MHNETNRQLMMVIFDGIDNSVFKSQVLTPLLNRIEEQKNLEVTLVSFERKEYSSKELMRIIPSHDKLHVILCPRTPFAGSFGLFIAGYYFKRIIRSIPLEKIIARGPLAGWVVLEFIKNLYKNNEQQELIDITIQARGLAAEEYRLACEQGRISWYHRLFKTWYYRTLQNIEYDVYRNDRFKRKYTSIEIETVSEALKRYLIEAYEAAADKVFIAKKDLILPINQEKIDSWRNKIRSNLSIPESAVVYCYSGSAKPWQCIEETVELMKEKMLSDKNVWGLLLLPKNDHPYIEQLLDQHCINQNQIILRSVENSHLLQYLSAADYGIVLRKKDIVNSVSRPTKLLEYNAVGLKIIHNDTIDYLKNN